MFCVTVIPFQTQSTGIERRIRRPRGPTHCSEHLFSFDILPPPPSYRLLLPIHNSCCLVSSFCLPPSLSSPFLPFAPRVMDCESRMEKKTKKKKPRRRKKGKEAIERGERGRVLLVNLIIFRFLVPFLLLPSLSSTLSSLLEGGGSMTRRRRRRRRRPIWARGGRRREGFLQGLRCR